MMCGRIPSTNVTQTATTSMLSEILSPIYLRRRAARQKCQEAPLFSAIFYKRLSLVQNDSMLWSKDSHGSLSLKTQVDFFQ